MTKKRISTAELRKRNRNDVFRLVYDAQTPVTKQDIANQLQMSLPTVTQNLKELMEESVLTYAGTDESTGGRKARLIAVNKNAYFAVGIELSPKHIRFIAINLKAEELAFERVEEQFSNTPEYRMLYAKRLEIFLDRHKLSREHLLGVGITLPGIVNEQKQIVEIAPVLGLHHMNVSLLTEVIPYPTYVQNDASAGGIAEWFHSQEPSAMAYLFIGKGVGGALLLNGKPYEGTRLHSAEFGHMCMHKEGGKRCSCGQEGCLEAYCSSSCLSDELGISLEDFFEALAQNQPQMQMVWKEFLEHLAMAIHNIHMALDCSIVIGGTVTPFLPPYMNQLQQELKKRSFFPDEEPYIFLGKCEGKANCIGVALYFIQGFLQEI